jgi:hypothetical protein
LKKGDDTPSSKGSRRTDPLEPRINDRISDSNLPRCPAAGHVVEPEKLPKSFYDPVLTICWPLLLRHSI